MQITLELLRSTSTPESGYPQVHVRIANLSPNQRTPQTTLNGVQFRTSPIRLANPWVPASPLKGLHES